MLSTFAARVLPARIRRASRSFESVARARWTKFHTPFCLSPFFSHGICRSLSCVSPHSIVVSSSSRSRMRFRRAAISCSKSLRFLMFQSGRARPRKTFCDSSRESFPLALKNVPRKRRVGLERKLDAHGARMFVHCGDTPGLDPIRRDKSRVIERRYRARSTKQLHNLTFLRLAHTRTRARAFARPRSLPIVLSPFGHGAASRITARRFFLTFLLAFTHSFFFSLFSFLSRGYSRAIASDETFARETALRNRS